MAETQYENEEEDEHQITAVEPWWVETPYIYEDGVSDGYLRLPDSTGDIEVTDPVAGMDGRGQYECKCGDTFDFFHDAEDHIVSVKSEE